MSGMYGFAGWLGQNSKTNKCKRILKELQTHMALHASGDSIEIRLNYLPVLSKMLTKPLMEDGGVDKVIGLMDDYYITRDDWDGILELGFQHLVTAIPSKNKAAFTRAYTK
jgi:replication factor C subunit 1